MSVPVTLGRFTFRSKTAAIAALRATRDAHNDNTPILDDDAVDLLLGVVAAHPQVAQKVGVGITGFFVATSPDYPTRCFYLQRSDGSVTDFSWNESISPATPINRLRMACRNAIEDHKTAFKEATWPYADTTPRVCPITQEPFNRGEAHVDHQPPQTIKTLVDAWLRAQGLTINDVPIDHIGDLRSVDTFADEGHRQQWRRFHQQNANLRLVSAAGNLRQGARLLEIDGK